MWTYEQSTGKLSHDGEHTAVGYSGFGVGKNNPALEALHDVGPIPRGKYRFGAMHDTDTHGPGVIPLFAFMDNDLHGRSGFLIHGDSKKDPGTASHGCIILPHDVRDLMAKSHDSDRVIEVVP